MAFRFDALSVSADQKAAIVEWAIGSISGLDASSRIRRCGELAVEIGWVDADAGVVLDKWCREGKTMDQARVEAAEKHLAELDSVESGVWRIGWWWNRLWAEILWVMVWEVVVGMNGRWRCCGRLWVWWIRSWWRLGGVGIGRRRCIQI